MVRLRFIIRRNSSEELFDEGGRNGTVTAATQFFKNKLNLIFAPQIIFRSATTASTAYHYQCRKNIQLRHMVVVSNVISFRSKKRVIRRTNRNLLKVQMISKLLYFTSQACQIWSYLHILPRVFPPTHWHPPHGLAKTGAATWLTFLLPLVLTPSVLIWKYLNLRITVHKSKQRIQYTGKLHTGRS